MDEWDELPAWQTQMYIEGLKDQGIIKDPEAPDDARSPMGQTGKPTPTEVDYAEDDWIPPGFKTRRAG